MEETLAVELNAIEALLPVLTGQLLSYLRMGKLKPSLLINLNVPQLRGGVRRVANNL